MIKIIKALFYELLLKIINETTAIFFIKIT